MQNFNKLNIAQYYYFSKFIHVIVKFNTLILKITSEKFLKKIIISGKKQNISKFTIFIGGKI